MEKGENNVNERLDSRNKFNIGVNASDILLY